MRVAGMWRLEWTEARAGSLEEGYRGALGRFFFQVESNEKQFRWWPSASKAIDFLSKQRRKCSLLLDTHCLYNVHLVQ